LANGWGSKEEQDKLAEQLHKLVRDVWSNQNIEAQEDWKKFIKKDRNIIESLKAIQKILKSEGLNKYDKALMQLVFYLFVAEGGFGNYMNFVCFLLTSQGHDLYNYFGRKFARSLDEIAEVESRTKELFLEQHCFEFHKGWDRAMRNNIAHYKFEIENDGTTTIEGNPTDVKKKLQQILYFVSYVSDNLIQEIQECRKSLSLQQAKIFKP